ncbi:MAG: potassium channel protein [Oceanospirillaceae bacterium]|nr:potassium channel protein [Oceanospirillaceae bacterium]MBT14343.1 potassium channel protein [Oceanospirillaceae bacterium]|tara:strand:+ start:2782 stop:3927 length:1146 start_codon:yes stop_codon:yes gene_type:complete
MKSKLPDHSVSRFISRHNRVRHAVYQTDRTILRSVRRSGLLLLGFALLHVAAMMWLEGMALWPAVWLTLTTLTTVGYGDYAAESQTGQIATAVLMFVCGITLMTFLISDYVDFRIARRERIRTGHWDWNMAEHILIINAPKYNREAYFFRMISQIRESEEYRDTPIQLLNEDFADGLPESLRELGVVHTTGSASRPDDMDRAGVERASHIVVLARDEYSADSDSYTFDIAYRLFRRGLGHLTIVECVEDENRERLKEMQVKTVLRPIRSYPEIIVRAMVAPGVELIIEDMFTHAEDHPVRFPVWLEGERWADVVNAIVQANLGTPLAYVTADGDVITHPDGDHHVHAQSVIILVHTEKTPTIRDVQRAVEVHFNMHAAKLD